jgi:LuxR family maltose regulon positive regulatory protein
MATTQLCLRLLHTKLFIPRAHPEIIERSNLIRKFNEGIKTRLILVTAPAACGKTTLLSKFMKQSNIHVAWVSLDDRDNEQIRFWSYFIAALQSLDASFEKSAKVILQSPLPPQIEKIMVLSRI